VRDEKIFRKKGFSILPDPALDKLERRIQYKNAEDFAFGRNHGDDSHVVGS
jgi:hypothetical protein